jgi:hypothetical protein
MDPFWTIVEEVVKMQYNPALVATWVTAVSNHAALVRNNAPENEQKTAHNIVKTLLVRLLMTVGVTFDDAMRAAGLNENEIADLGD